ncbi:MAG TPA: response regulator [Polyangiales bacterium]
MASLPQVSAASAGIPPARVVIAEDDVEMRSLLATALRADGCEVRTAHNAEQLMHVLDELRETSSSSAAVDLIISDIRMPGMSGLQALETLRKSHGATPVILITGFGDPDTHAEAHRLGAVAVFNKPFDIDDLRTVVGCLCHVTFPR